MLINIICQPRHKNKSGVPTGSIRRGQLLHTSATHQFGEAFKENTSADVVGIYFIKSFCLFVCFLGAPCTLDTDTVLAHASFTDCDLALRHTALEQREAPRMESVSCVGLSGSRGRDITKETSSHLLAKQTSRSKSSRVSVCTPVSFIYLPHLVCSSEGKTEKNETNDGTDEGRLHVSPRGTETARCLYRNAQLSLWTFRPAAHFHINKNINLL